MAIKNSTGLRNAMLATGSAKAALDGGRITFTQARLRPLLTMQSVALRCCAQSRSTAPGPESCSTPPPSTASWRRSHPKRGAAPSSPLVLPRGIAMSPRQTMARFRPPHPAFKERLP